MCSSHRTTEVGGHPRLWWGTADGLPLALLPIGEEEGTRPGWANGSHPSSLLRTLGPVVQTPFPGLGTKGPSPAPLHTPSCVLQSAQGNPFLLGTPCHPHAFPAPACTSGDSRGGNHALLPPPISAIGETDRQVCCVCCYVCLYLCICICTCVGLLIHVPSHLFIVSTYTVRLWFHCMYTCVCTCAHVCLHLYLYVHLHACLSVCLFVCDCIVCVPLCLSVFVCMYVCIYVCLFVCVSVWTHGLRTPPVGGIWPTDMFGLALIIFSTS